MPKLTDLACVFLLSCCRSMLLIATALRTDASEVEALLVLKGSLIDPMDNLKNWNKGDPCTANWTGVVCFNPPGTGENLHVIELQLLNMNLSGNLAPKISQLSHLTKLDFMWNDLTGTIPKEIGSIGSLKLLLLNGNRISGTLPDELGNLTKLNRFQIDQNQISGQIPRSYANLISVRHLHFNNNTLSGHIPSELSKLSKLLHLLLDNNNLSGPLPPEFSTLPDLRILTLDGGYGRDWEALEFFPTILQLDNNNFNGEIPVSYQNFSTLVKLSLRNCSLEGRLLDFSTVANLTYLDLSWNHFTGPIPSTKLSTLMTTIILSHNQLNGSIPSSFSNLPILQTLSLKNNSLNGSIPSAMWQKMSFSTNDRLTLDLRDNLFSDILGDMELPTNVSLRLAGNPICKTLSGENMDRICASKIEIDGLHRSPRNSTEKCDVRGCPTDDAFEYVPGTPDPCFCASPLGVGYRLKSPSFSYFPPYKNLLEEYLANNLHLEMHQLLIDSYVWDGSRLEMFLKIFPLFNSNISILNKSEVERITEQFMSWEFPRTDFFGPYELLNFTLPGHSPTFIIVTQKTHIGVGILAAIIVGSIACIFLVIAVTILLFTRRTSYHHNLSRKNLSSKIALKIDGVKAFTFKEMLSATGNFNSSTKVGQGGYGKVYKGILSDNSVVAIKRAEEGSLQGQKEFLTEIELLSRLHHRNLVSLIGYCDEEGEQMLVYEFMPNGTLRDWISGKTMMNMNFAMRLQIALGAAKGILYLHTEANPPIFHRDIKASNILLDAKLTAKVADFGLSRLAPDLDHEGAVPRYISTVVKGTPGYLDPEYFLTHKLTDKSDVYSLGVVLLELLTGMHPISHGKNIVREVKMAREQGKIFGIVDSKLGGYASECIEKFAGLGVSCCHDKPEERPSMLVVVREMENVLKMMEGEGEGVDASSDMSSQSSRSKLLASPASSYVNVSKEHFGFASGSMSGSDLISGVMPTINPR